MVHFSAPLRSQFGRTRRNRSLLLAFAVFAGLGYLVLSNRVPDYVDTNLALFESTASNSHPAPTDRAAKDFWRGLAEVLYKTKPSFEEVRRVTEHSPWITYNRVEQSNRRPDYLNMTYAEMDELRKLNLQGVEESQKLAPKVPFLKGTRGIVTTAGYDALAILTTSLWMLRASGSRLPVEIWFDKIGKSEQKIPCERIFPSLGAKCMYMDQYLPDDLEHPIHMVKFTFKTLALLFSHYEQILFLDCDAFPVNNPDNLFVTEPFISTGLVTWPDYWASTASHYWYDITGLPEPDMKEMATTESGEMLISKDTHAAALLLVQMYNVWGPEHWHRLLSQSAPGEGDKDTFLAAAQMYKLPWYQVAEPPQRVGYRCDKKHAIGSGQSHPYDDYLIRSNGVMTHEEGLDIGECIHPRILFVHANLPKLDPYILLDWKLPELEWNDMLRCDQGKGKAHRLWGPRDLHVAKYGWDVEKQLWDGLRWEACAHEQDYEVWTVGSIFRHTEDLRHDLCSEITKLYVELFPGEKWTGKMPKPGRRERPWNGYSQDI